MRTLTNNHGLPESFMNALKRDTHPVSGDISVSQLIAPPQVRYLKRLHDVEEDAMDFIFMSIGTALHKWLESGNSPDFDATAVAHVADLAKMRYNDTQDVRYQNLVKAIQALSPPPSDRKVYVEQTLTVAFENITLYGTSDYIETFKAEHTDHIYGEHDYYNFSRLEDHKMCSVYAWMYPESREKWIEQLNIYAWMAEKNGFPPVAELWINAYFRDWSRSRLLNNADYPKQPFMRIQIPRKSNEEIETFVNSRLALHRMADNGTPPECNGADRWASADSYVVKTKKNEKSAIRGSKRDTLKGAEDFIKEIQHKYQPGDLYVETRPGESRKCESYCPVRSVCPQYKRIQELTREEL